MSKSFIGRIILPAAGMILLGACAPLPSYRYEITVEIDTPSGLRTGSSVVEITSRREPKLLPDMLGASRSFRGEAAAIDLPNGRTIFALLKGENWAGSPFSIALNLLTPSERTSIPELEAGKVLRAVRRTTELPRAAYPLLVTFRDPADPQSIEAVDPDSMAQFDPGARLRRITISSTDKPVTGSIQKRLPWLSKETSLTVKGPDGVSHMFWGDRFKN